MRYLAALLSVCVTFACGAAPPTLDGSDDTGPPSGPAEGTRGMVSSAHPLATEAGLAILKKGGNAFDAAVTIASSLNVVEPMMSGMGGYGTILVYDAEGMQALYLDASGKIPVGVDPDAYRPPTPDFMENRRNAKAVSTPGAANAWEAMSMRFGRLAWGEYYADRRCLSVQFVRNNGAATVDVVDGRRDPRRPPRRILGTPDRMDSVFRNRRYSARGVADRRSPARPEDQCNAGDLRFRHGHRSAGPVCPWDNPRTGARIIRASPFYSRDTQTDPGP